MQVPDGKSAKENIIHEAFRANPQFPIITGGGPTLRNSQGIPWCPFYIHSNGDLIVGIKNQVLLEKNLERKGSLKR